MVVERGECSMFDTHLYLQNTSRIKKQPSAKVGGCDI